MDLKPDQGLRMLKPAFGDARAPKLWNDTAQTAMDESDFVTHPLEKCLYLSYRPAMQAEQPDFYTTDKTGWTLDGILGLHVDDYLGSGENVSTLNDIEGAWSNPDAINRRGQSFLMRMFKSMERFKWGKWDFGWYIIFCGTEITQSQTSMELMLTQQEYMHKAKPISIEKHRRATPDDDCTPREHTQFRGCTGTMQWPAAQSMTR